MGLNKRLLLLATGDVAAAFMAVPSAFFVEYRRMPAIEDISGIGETRILSFVLIVVFLSFMAEFYRSHCDLCNRDIFVKISASLGVSCFVFAFASWQLPRDVSKLLLLAVAFFGVFQLCCHLVYRLLVKFRGLARRILILGVGPVAGHMGQLVPSTDENYVLSGFIRCSDELAHVPASTILENPGGLYETVKREKADKIVVSLSEKRGALPFQEVMACKLNGIEVVDAPSFYEQITGKLFLEGINPSWIIFSDGFKVRSWRKAMKRVMDLFCATAGIILTGPFFPLIALLIKLDSKGPVFYRQERAGQGEKSFLLYKFRTMRVDAESGTGAVWAQENDSRVTRIGEFFRKCRIDELPQFFNILCGDMSMVGPRPERPEFVEQLKRKIPYYSERHLVKPGVTGWAQVRYPYGASVEDALEKLRYDLYYIKNISLTFDMMIILETIQVVLFRRGSR